MKNICLWAASRLVRVAISEIFSATQTWRHAAGFISLLCSALFQCQHLNIIPTYFLAPICRFDKIFFFSRSLFPVSSLAVFQSSFNKRIGCFYFVCVASTFGAFCQAPCVGAILWWLFSSLNLSFRVFSSFIFALYGRRRKTTLPETIEREERAKQRSRFNLESPESLCLEGQTCKVISDVCYGHLNARVRARGHRFYN